MRIWKEEKEDGIWVCLMIGQETFVIRKGLVEPEAEQLCDRLSCGFSMEFNQSSRQSPIDWEQRRFELTKSISHALLTNPEAMSMTIEKVISNSIEWSDDLIRQLKK